MPPSEQSRIFISYAHRDGAELAQRLQMDLANEGFDAWIDIQRLQAGEVWSVEIEQAIDRAHVFVALLSAGSYTSDICRAEHSRALEKGKCVVPVLVQTDCEIPLQLQTRQWLDFSSPVLYPEQLPKLIVSIEKRAGVAVSAELLIRYNNAPSLPQNFVNRPELLEALRNTLFTEGANRNIALTAMQGMGGIGKTVLAQAICHDEVVHQAFPDGIFWFAIGKESQLDFSSRMKGVPGLDRLLGHYDGEAACLSQYRDILRKKAALIVVDDVWRASDIEPFIAKSPRSRLLITTRDTSIGSAFGAREFTANLLTEDESRQVLAKWSGRAVEELPPMASEVIRECGYLPLALAMIGAQLKGKPPALWNAVLDHLRKADLEKIRAQFPKPHTTLFGAIRVSVDALDATVRERYLALAVLLEDMAAAPQVQQCIWGMDEAEAAETAEQLIGLSLAQRDGTEGSIRLHDLQLDYVRAQYSDKEALKFVHGAIRLSSNVIDKDPGQFASQMVGRLLPYKDMSTIKEFTNRVAEGTRTHWLRALQPALHPPGTSLIRTLEGHADWPLDAAVSLNGRLAMSASRDGTMKLWDLDRGIELRTLEGHSGVVCRVAVSGAWDLAISASSDKTLKVWELANGRELRTLEGHSDTVTGVAVSKDGRLAVSSSVDRTIKVWDVANGCELRTLEGHSDYVPRVAMSSDGRLAVSASHDRTLKVWDLESGRELHTLEGHSAAVKGVAVSGDGCLAVSSSDDRTIKVWDVASGRELRALQGHSWGVEAVAVSEDGRLAVSASDTLKVWHVESGREVRDLEGHSTWIESVALSGDGRIAVSASRDGTLKVWDVERVCKVHTLAGHSDSVSGVALTRDGRFAVSASSDNSLKLWEVATGRELRTLQGHTAEVFGVAVSEDGRLAVSASNDNTLKAWDLLRGRELRTLDGRSGVVNGVALSGDGRLAVSAFSEKTLKVWDVESGLELHTLAGHSESVFGVGLSKNGRLAVSASKDKTLKIWDLENGLELRTLRGHSWYVDGVAVSENGGRAVSASWDHTLKLWDVDSGRELRTLRGHNRTVDGVALSWDSRLAISASWDHTVRVWDLESGAVLASFTCDTEAHCCAFSDALKLIVAGDAGGHLHFLHLEEPKAKS